MHLKFPESVLYSMPFPDRLAVPVLQSKLWSTWSPGMTMGSLKRRGKKEENGETQNAKVNVKATQLQPTLILDCSLLSGERKN